MMTSEAIEQGPEEQVTINLSEYQKLISDRDFLHALQSAGVDNWDGYDYAREILGDDGDE
jgi:hypothetical protein